VKAFCGLSGTIEDIAQWCQVDVGVCFGQIDDRIRELEATLDDDEQPLREWVESDESRSEIAQEIEVRRIFHGLALG
jgi:hypothetical protein